MYSFVQEIPFEYILIFKHFPVCRKSITNRMEVTFALQNLWLEEERERNITVWGLLSKKSGAKGRSINYFRWSTKFCLGR